MVTGPVKAVSITLVLFCGIGSSSLGRARATAFADIADDLATPTVKLGPIFKLSTAPQATYSVSFDYDFPGRNQIYIRGVGLVSPKGKLHYIHSGETLEFLDAPNGTILYTATMDHSVTLMGDRAPTIPDEGEFPKESRHGRWRGNGEFADTALSVLEKYFRSGYRAYESEDSLFYLTTYAEVAGIEDGTFTEVSVLITHPVKTDAHDTAFTVAFLARERRSHTGWRDSVSDLSRRRSEIFVDDLLSALQH